MHGRSWIEFDAQDVGGEVWDLRVDAAISRPFTIVAEVALDTPDADLEALLWSGATVFLAEADSEPRAWHGVIEEASFGGGLDGRWVYHLTLRPRLSGLGYRRRSRIFQDLDVVGVVRRVLRDAGLDDEVVAWAVTRPYPTRAYCVQYRETELDFVSRLLEDEGIFYAFEHAPGQHVLRLGDSDAAFSDLDGASELTFSKDEHGAREHVTDLVFTSRLRADVHLANDWNQENPARVLEAEARGEEGPTRFRHEYPGGFADNRDGGRRARDRREAQTAHRDVLRGRSNCLRLAPGRRFTLAGARPEHLCQPWLLTRTQLHFRDPARHPDADARQSLQVRFEAIPASVPYRSMRVTPRPRVAGKECAVIAGPPGEEIHVDAQGRVKVHFYWDREGAVDDRATCWMRVQQANTAGAMMVPRVGWEVDVGFENGDPDRPVVLQKLFNQETMPPYALPAEKTQGAWQTSTYPGGAGTNEVRLQDGNGGMMFFVHASRDFALHAAHDLSERVTANATEQVTLTRTASVKASETVTVAGNQTSSVVGDEALETNASRTVSIGATDTWKVTKNQAITVNGSRTESVGGMMMVLANKVSETFNGSATRTVGAVQMVNSATVISESVGGSREESIGGARIEVTAKGHTEAIGGSKTLVTGAVLEKIGGDITANAEGAMAITVGGPYVSKCGGAFTLGARAVVITVPGGLTLSAGGGKLVARGGKVSFEGPSLAVKGTASITLKGRINYKG
ncbi:MAG: type VI secretion system tip protein TssI/VgrG [Deltaproteobacteria bacterium]|nr:type VI secretion system tip protein TssI/VgrG [Myxococcales bacterium]MDP3220888.1 type VI secretion system tip protein TssI/VgrG [Deltaproteobacteria bacterium]